MLKDGFLAGSVQSDLCERLHTPTNVAYHFDDERVDEIYQEEELPTSFVIEPGAALDSLVGDGADVTILQKWKQQIIILLRAARARPTQAAPRGCGPR
jgi:hypothetical protein